MSRNFLGRTTQNLLCTVQYGPDMIVSVHVAPPLSDISTFKAVFGLGWEGRLEEYQTQA